MPRLPFPKSTLDSGQVLQFAFNEETGKLRTEAQVTAVIGEVQIESSAADGDNIAISDGVNTLDINPDGSINTNIINTLNVSGSVDALFVGINQFTYNEISIAAGATVTIISQLFSTAYKLRKVRGSGENIGVFTLKFNAAGVDKYRTTYTDFNYLLDYETGISIPAGTTVTIEATNVSNSPSLYSTQILYSAK